jgi:hypothetical protein
MVSERHANKSQVLTQSHSQSSILERLVSGCWDVEARKVGHALRVLATSTRAASRARQNIIHSHFLPAAVTRCRNTGLLILLPKR